MELPRIHAVMSVPRLGFMDNFFCSINSLPAAGISLQQVTGAFWGQCLQTGMEKEIERGAEIVLTLDYDTLFSLSDVAAVARAVADGFDCAMPLQVKRHDGRTMPQEVDGVLIGHFGLTAFRAGALATLQRPWFMPRPDRNGTWNGEHEDEDVFFWRLWARTGRTIGVLENMAIGHIQPFAMWPNGIVQQLSDFHAHGPPPPWRVDSESGLAVAAE